MSALPPLDRGVRAGDAQRQLHARRSPARRRTGARGADMSNPCTSRRRRWRRPWPTDLVFDREAKLLRIAFDDGAKFDIPFELLRVESPSAENKGHGDQAPAAGHRQGQCQRRARRSRRPLRRAHRLRRRPRHRPLFLGPALRSRPPQGRAADAFTVKRWPSARCATKPDGTPMLCAPFRIRAPSSASALPARRTPPARRPRDRWRRG